MAELLLALGLRPTALGALRFLGAVGTATACVVLLTTGATALLGVPAPVMHLGAWLVWLLWLGLVFPRDRRTSDCPRPYRLAFLLELLPGIGCNFALLVRPAIQGLVEAPALGRAPLDLLTGGVLLLAAVGLIGAGVWAIGFARTFFVYEYAPSRAAPVTRGVYRSIRHPLFLGGVTGSVGLALLVGGPVPLALAAINVAMLPAYVLFEDRRCTKLMGDAYLRYRAATGAVLPLGWRP